MNTKTRRRSLPLVLAFTLAALLAAGIGLAAWNATGAGTAAANAGSASELTIDGVSAGTLFPTATVDVTVAVTNPNPYSVSVTEIGLAAAGVTTDAVGCDAASVSFNGPFSYALDALVVGAGDSADVALADALTMSNAAADACQGATFTVNLELTGESTAS